MPTPASPVSPHSPRVPTGVEGLDEVLHGGLPAGRLYLLEGSPGAGKTTIALQFLLNAVAAGEKALYVTLSETSEELTAVAASHGWSLDGLELFEFSPVDQLLGSDRQQTLLHPSEVELGETIRLITQKVDALRPTRVVLDSLSEVRLLAQDALRYRRQVLALKQHFARLRITVLHTRAAHRRGAEGIHRRADRRAGLRRPAARSDGRPRA